MKICLSILGILASGIIFCCTEKAEIEPELLGKWTDNTVTYHFKADKTYGTRYLIQGKGNDSLKVDSSFGDYEVYKDNRRIIFSQKGYFRRNNPNAIYNRKEISWKYELDRNILKYNSNTSFGQLTKIN